MSNIRLYELAKELGLNNKALLELCGQLGIDGKTSHSNSLNDDEADRIRRSVIRQAVSGDSSEKVRSVHVNGSTLTERRSGNVIRRRKKSTSEDAEAGEVKTLDLASASSISSSIIGNNTPNPAADTRNRQEALAQADALFGASEQDNSSQEVETSVQTDSNSMDLSETTSAETIADVSTESSHVDLQDSDEFAESIEEEDLVTDSSDSDSDSDSTTDQQPESVVVVLEPEKVVPEDELQTITETPSSSTITIIDPLDEVRRRHDVRAPKVLGKIALPSKEPAPKKASPKKTAQAAQAEPAETEVDGGSKDGPPKGGRPSRRKGGGEEVKKGDFGRRHKPRKQILKKDELLDYTTERDSWRKGRDKKSKKGRSDGGKGDVTESAPTRASKLVVKIDSEISVGELARTLGAKVGEVITKLMGLGVMANVNQVVDFDTATVIASEFGFTTVNTGHDEDEFLSELKKTKEGEVLEPRPPVVTVMGHVDHGKTSLLDAIRKTAVTKGEAGGITQHIGAYNVSLENGKSVTFLDTPGHEAFTAMRGRGAKVTDIVVLVVAADDGVMPQTIEAINHAKAAEVPIVVAMNKIDKEGANPDRIMKQLGDHGLIPEEWGGDTMIVPVSAITREGIDNLIETLQLQAEVMELKACPDRPAYGVVIESTLERGRGPVITVLVKNGTIKEGDAFLVGSTTGKVRALNSYEGLKVKKMGPGMPVEILGSSITPEAGDEIFVLKNEAQARSVAEHRFERQRAKNLASKGGSRVALSLESFSEMVKQGEIKQLPIIVKADTQGSVEALREALIKLENEEVGVQIIHSAVGGITESDVHLAHTSGAVIVGFNVRYGSGASDLVDKFGVDVRFSRVIYELLDSLNKALLGLMAPKFEEKQLGHVEVRQTFKVPKLGVIAGSYVTDGSVERGANVRLLRDSRVVYEGKMASLRRFKDDVKEVGTGYECGIGIEGYSDIQDGDIIEVYKIEEVQQGG